MRKPLALAGLVLVCVLSSGTLTPAHAGPVSIGSAVNYSVLAIEGQTLFNDQATVTGNEGISQGGKLVVSGSTVTGNVYQYSSGQTTNQGTVDGSIVTSSSTLSQNDADVATAISEINSLVPIEVINGNIATATTIDSTETWNVVKVDGSINLNSANLTLSGNAGDFFVVVVSGGMRLTGSAGFLVSGGLAIDHVIYDFAGSKSGLVTNCGNNTVLGAKVDYQLCAAQGTEIEGTLLAPNLSILLGGTLTGEAIGGSNIYLQSGASVLPGASVDSGPGLSLDAGDTPEPATILLFGSGLCAAAGLRKHRSRLGRRTS